MVVSNCDNHHISGTIVKMAIGVNIYRTTNRSSYLHFRQPFGRSHLLVVLLFGGRGSPAVSRHIAGNRTVSQ